MRRRIDGVALVAPLVFSLVLGGCAEPAVEPAELREATPMPWAWNQSMEFTFHRLATETADLMWASAEGLRVTTWMDEAASTCPGWEDRMFGPSIEWGLVLESARTFLDACASDAIERQYGEVIALNATKTLQAWESANSSVLRAEQTMQRSLIENATTDVALAAFLVEEIGVQDAIARNTVENQWRRFAQDGSASALRVARLNALHVRFKAQLLEMAVETGTWEGDSCASCSSAVPGAWTSLADLDPVLVASLPGSYVPHVLPKLIRMAGETSAPLTHTQAYTYQIRGCYFHGAYRASHEGPPWEAWLEYMDLYFSSLRTPGADWYMQLAYQGAWGGGDHDGNVDYGVAAAAAYWQTHGNQPGCDVDGPPVTTT